MKLFRAMMADSAIPSGSASVMLNLEQVVFAFGDPYDDNKTLVRMTGEANVFVLLASFEDVRLAMEEVLE